MENSKKLDNLLQQLPNKGEVKFEREQSLAKTITLIGELKGKDQNEIVLKNDDTYYFIPIETIEEVVQNESKPYIEKELIEITVKVSKGTTIKLMKYVNVDDFGDKIGTKPLVYDIPSRASDFSVVGTDFEKKHTEWFQKMGLTDYRHSEGADTVTTTYYSTPKQTSQQSPTTTRTSNNDTQIDYSTDYITDFFNDPTVDMD